MGKKIPTKKHNKLKSVDPFNRKSNSNIFKGEDGLHNLAPKKLSQESPRSLKKLFAESDEVTDRPSKRRKKTKRITVRTVDHRNQTASLVSQNVFETDEQFLKRVSQMANRARERTDISVKFDVRLNEDGTVEHDLPEGTNLPTRKKRRLQQYKEKQRLRSLKRQGKSQPSGEDVPKEFPGREHFQFGETVHSPPEITARIRGAPEHDSKKIAKSLLCNRSNFTKANSQNAESLRVHDEMTNDRGLIKEKKTMIVNSPAGTKEKVLEKIRWKKLDTSKRAELELERKRVIQAYRKMKNKVILN